MTDGTVRPWLDRPMAQAAEFWPTPTIIVDLQRRLVGANAAGHDVLKRGPALRIREDRLSTRRKHEQKALDVALEAAATDAGQTPWPGRMSFRNRQDEFQLGLLARCIPGHDDQAPVLLVCVFAFNAVIRLDSSIVGDVLGITHMQARVAGLLLSGLEVPVIAARTGLAVETVRRHLKGAMARTNTHSQAQLVALMARGVASVTHDLGPI